MKNLFLLTALLIATFTSNLSSQNASIIMGVSAGANVSKVKGTGDFVNSGEKFSRILRYGGGIDLGVRFGNFSVLTGARYNQRGGKSTLNLDDPNGYHWLIDDKYDLGIRYSKFTYNTISIPILLRYEFGGESFKVSLSAGPSINLIAGTGTQIDEYDLLNGGLKGPFEGELKKGTLGDEILAPKHVSFIFSPGFIYKINDNGNIKLNFNFEASGNVINKSYLTTDSNGASQKNRGSVKSGSMAVEIGYEHRINLSVGSKY